jgi:hypothetical protein
MTRNYLLARGRQTAALFAALLTLSACGHFVRNAQSDAQIVFVNESLDQADVYASGTNGDPVRIGTVFGNRSETLKVPPTVVAQGGGQINVIVHILAGSNVSSGPFPLRAGDTMRVRLTSDKRSLIVVPGS